MTIQDVYIELQGDFEDARRRLMNEPMVVRFVKKFPADPSMQQLRDAVEAEDIETSFRAVHTLKSVSGVLGFTKLFEVAVALTEQLRPRLDYADPELLAAVEAEYARTIAVLDKFMAEENA